MEIYGNLGLFGFNFDLRIALSRLNYKTIGSDVNDSKQTVVSRFHFL